MAFGICGRNKEAEGEGANQEARKTGITVETLCQTPGVSQRRPTVSAEDSGRYNGTSDSPTTFEIDLQARL